MARPATDRLVHDDHVLGLTRIVSVAVIPFLLVSVPVLLIWPGESGRLFAWPVMPALTAMILGAVYLGGAYFFFRAARAHQWHAIKGGFLPIATFATLMGVATVLHWGKFTHSHVAFWLWAFLYFTTPFLIVGVWVRNRRREDRRPVDDVTVPAAMARIIGAIGVLAVAVSVFLFLFPEQAIEVWPWMLTPLTARTMGAIFALGVAAVGAFSERRWSAFRIMVQVEVFMLVLIVIAGIRSAADMDPSNVLTWLFAAGFPGLVVVSIVLYARLENRAR